MHPSIMKSGVIYNNNMAVKGVYIVVKGGPKY